MPALPAIVDHRSDALAAMWLVTMYVLLILLGVVVFRSPGTMVGGNMMSVPRAVFTSINAATLTGLPQTMAVDQYLPPGQWMVLALMVGGTFFTLTASTLAVSRIIGLNVRAWRVCAFAIAVQLIATLIGGVLLYTRERGAFGAMFLATSAFGNVGLTVEPRPLLGEMRTMFVLLPLSILGGLGLPVLIDLFDRIRGVRPQLLPHTRIVLMGLSIAFVVGTIVAFYFAVPPTLTADASPLGNAFSTSAALTINARSAGFPLDRIDAFPRALPWFAMVLMLVGAAPAGTSGGLKVTAFYVLFRDVLKLLRGETPTRALAVAIVWITLLGLTITVTVLALAPSQAQLPGDRLLFIAISAACNVGLVHNPISINETNGYFLSAAMVLGRFLPIGVVWWQSRVGRDDVAVA